jgi:PKD repeat protein
MKYAYVSLLVCLVFFSCKKKELPLPIDGNPIFKFIGTIGADSVNYQAGINRMFMYTGFYKDPQNLMTVKSYFGKDSCTNCEPYLSFEVKDFDVTNTNGLAGTIADLLKGGGTFNSFSLDSIFSVTNIETFTFIPQVTNANATYKWDFGDGGTSTQMSPNYIFASGGMKNVQLILQVNGSVPDTMVNQINSDVSSSCRAQFNMIQDSMVNKVVVNAYPAGFTYMWDFGDGHTGQGQTDSNMYLPPATKYTITLTATAPSCTTSVFKQKVNFTSALLYPANFNYQTNVSTITASVPRVNKSAFIITWKKNGVTYKSYKNEPALNQSGNPVFTFTGITPYIKNAAGNSTVMVTGTVDTYLYNQADWHDSIKISSKNVVLAAAYPD